jgi:DNA-binding XRE family transcriptional regulator
MSYVLVKQSSILYTVPCATGSEASEASVNAVETGRCDPGLELAFRIARLFGRSVEGVFEPDADFSQGDGAR